MAQVENAQQIKYRCVYKYMYKLNICIYDEKNAKISPSPLPLILILNFPWNPTSPNHLTCNPNPVVMRDRPVLNSARVIADLTEDGSWFQEWEIIYEKELWIWLEVFTGWETLRAEERNL